MDSVQAQSPEIDISGIIDSLNQAFKDDPAAIHALVCNRVPCNEKLAAHPSIAVETSFHFEKPRHSVGAIGLLNGVLEKLTGKKVALMFSENRENDGRHLLLGFCEYNGKNKVS